MSRSNLGARIELISPSARAVRFPAVSDILAITNRIMILIDGAKYNKEALPIMKCYLMAVKEAIDVQHDGIDEEYTLELVKALEEWERFLEQYTKPKMKTLLVKLQNNLQIDKKIRGLFDKLDKALNDARLEVELEDNAKLREYIKIPREKTHDTGGCCMMDIDDNLPTTIRPDSTSIKDDMKKAFEDDFVTTACFHGLPLPPEKLNNLKVDPTWVHSIPDAQYNGVGPEKVVYCGGSHAAKIKIAHEGEDISRYWVRAYISSQLNTDLFMRNYGILLENGVYYMITEWPEVGTLSKYLADHTDIPWGQRIGIATRLARALAICHSKYILHHDIRSHNVTVGKNNIVKLGNYHRTRHTKDITTSVAEESDGVRWLCPEKVVDGSRPYSMAADVYSFGMLMWEISSHKIPFTDKTVGEVYTLLKDSAKFKDKDAPRPPIIPGTPKKYENIMKRCWRQDPGTRPNMAYVLKKLERLDEAYRKNSHEPDTMYWTGTTSMPDSEPQHEPITIYSARKLHTEKRHAEAFKQFKSLADDENPNAEANFYVGRYLIDSRIGYENDPNVGISYLEIADQLGFHDALQYRAQEKMAAATELRKKFIEAGKLDDAALVMERMKTECLPMFREGAERGNLRCMKDLADYGAKLGDKQSYVDGLKMLDNIVKTTKDPKQKAKAQDFLVKLQQHKDTFMD
ncbi:10892_t:CDS:2 [Paraglomus occultum]|uniref:10892_t:CDS:1 n=1 Tax=Paraglomus occultum TaxID=144539 RepID=A0A9N9BXK7_9GLOM|nr:10892_t:CDS:2 [Paraglomus occultum]